jgi:glycosyltransferase involved in cell wall biosynthesis
MRKFLEQRAEEMNIGTRVRFLGNRSDVAQVLAATSVSVLASHFEGTSNALIESMCAGVPVVTTDYAGAEELVTDGQDGFVVPRNDVGALADRIARLLENPPLRTAMGARGRETVGRRFSLEQLGQGLLRVYRLHLDACSEVADGRSS